MDKELKSLRRQVYHLEAFISDNIARIIFERIVSTYTENQKLLSILRQKVDGKPFTVRDDFTMWVEYIEPRIALEIMNTKFEWSDLRLINGLIDSLCELYYSFDLSIQ